MRLGVHYRYQPKRSSIFRVKSGLYFFNRKYRTETDINAFQAQLGFDLGFGNTTKAVVGAELSMNYNLNLNDRPSDWTYETPFSRRIQIGSELNLGVEYKINNMNRVGIDYQNHVDITNLAQQDRQSPGGAQYTLNLDGHDGSIGIYFLRKLN